ncbi:MAG: NAD(P)/FAD-dependent oxidoreductase [Gammaproteobacteria bacterium]|nr:NAD(P)/FAD-dependent oxidoreductase [Gammaproteobacteria bacterium]
MVSESELQSFDVIVVGAGFGGMYSLYRLRERGLRVRVLEAGTDVGGTWYWNRYPGARCDVESMEYSYSFSEELQQEWEWTERYAAQPEILRYAEHVADRFDLRKDIQFETRVTAAAWDEESSSWLVRTDDGAALRARFVVWATGCLSVPNVPGIDGLDSFAGEVYHTGRWPHEEVNFRGRRVGVIGTGSSAIQAVPMIAEQGAELYVFQRQPNYSVPANNRPLDPEVQQSVKENYTALREENLLQPGGFGSKLQRRAVSVFDESPEEREREFEKRWKMGGFAFLAGYGDLLRDEKANQYAADFVRRKIHEIVDDPELADLLSPHHIIGCRRLCVDTDYYRTFNRPNVHLVDVSTDPIERITPQGVVTGGKEYPLDDIILATGFDAMTGALLRIDIQGRSGVSIQEKWREGPKAYLGMTIAGFPNMFTINGPGSPSVLSNMITAIEQNVDWIDDCITYMREKGYAAVEAESQAETAWADRVKELADGFLYGGCNSWWSGANIEGKPRSFMAYVGFPDYVDRCNEVVEKGYAGFRFE